MTVAQPQHSVALAKHGKKKEKKTQHPKINASKGDAGWASSKQKKRFPKRRANSKTEKKTSQKKQMMMPLATVERWSSHSLARKGEGVRRGNSKKSKSAEFCVCVP